MKSEAHPAGGRGPATISVDGPAAAGKSTVGRMVADSLGYLYFDTGAIYRALTVLAHDGRVGPADEERLADLARSVRIDVVPRPARPTGYAVEVKGVDITDRLRSAAVDSDVSQVSSHGRVRDALLAQQRRVAGSRPTVMVGRDIGTVVLPDADLKVYLDASAEARARRRFREVIATGGTESYLEVLQSIRARDEFDAGRATAPLSAAPDAVLVATDDCNVEEVVRHLLRLVARWPDRLTTEGGEAPCRTEQ